MKRGKKMISRYGVSILVLSAALLVSACAVPALPPTSTLPTPLSVLPTEPPLPTFTATSPTATNTAVPPTRTDVPAPVEPTSTGAAATETLTVPTLASTKASDVPAASGLPILYTDIIQKDGHRTAVTKAVDASGKDLGTVAESFGAAWAPDGKTFAYVNADGTELVQGGIGAPGKTLARAKTDERFRRLPIWSPDGKRIAVIARNADANDGKEVVVIENAQEVARYELPPLDQEHIWNPNKFRWSPDSKKILLSWDYTIVIHTDTGDTETISDHRVLAEWAPTSDAVYYFELVTPGLPYGDLGDFVLKKLGDTSATFLMNGKAVSALGLHTNISAFDIRVENLQFNRGLMDLSPDGKRFVLVTGLPTGSRFSFFDLTLRETIALDDPTRTVETDFSTGAVEWSPDKTQVAVIAIGGNGAPDVSVRVLDLATDHWSVLALLGIKIPSYRFLEQIDFIGTTSSKILSWTE